jgi:hypothetical protein
MTKQHLWYLAAALVALLALRLLLDRSPGTAGSLDEAGLSLVLDGAVAPELVRFVRVTGPGQGQALVVERGPKGWTLSSAHGAPADAPAVDAFVESVLSLRGELRGEGEFLHAEFGVDPGSAARVELGTSSEEIVAELLVGGEGDRRGAHFVRSEGSERIPHALDGVTEALGLVGDSRTPSPEHWLNLQLFDLVSSDIDRIQVDRPDQHWLLEKAPPPGAEEGTPAEWRVVEPPTGLEADAAGADGLVGRLARVRAASVLDPASEACAPAALKRRIRVEAGERSLGLGLGDRLLDGDRFAARLDGDGTCWALARWTADSLMPRAGQLLELGRPFGDPPPEAAEFTRLDLVTGEGRLRLERDDEGWRISRPQRAAADGPRVDRLLSALRFLSWDDLAAEAAVETAARETHLTITAHAAERSWTLRLLGERAGAADGSRYAEFEGGPSAPPGHLLVVASSSVESLDATLEDLRADSPEEQ